MASSSPSPSIKAAAAAAIGVASLAGAAYTSMSPTYIRYFTYPPKKERLLLRLLQVPIPIGQRRRPHLLGRRRRRLEEEALDHKLQKQVQITRVDESLEVEDIGHHTDAGGRVPGVDEAHDGDEHTRDHLADLHHGDPHGAIGSKVGGCGGKWMAGDT